MSKMGKDSEVTVKKRRKLTAVAPVNDKPPDIDVYKTVIQFEEKEAANRSAEKDGIIFRKTCEEIRILLSEIAELKKEHGPSVKAKINEKRVQVSLLVVVLKKLNRLEKFRAKAGRETLHKKRQKLDSTYLLLQNLLYEADHVDKEVTKRIQFKSKDEDIELVSVDEFYSEAPPEVSRPEVTKNDEHQQRLARLEWELQQRRQLAKSCNDLAGAKEEIGVAIAEARSRIGALAPLLKDILKSTKPLQEKLNMRLDEQREQAQIASVLPPPLFLLYANSSAFADIFGENVLSVDISGDEEEARRIESTGVIDLRQENSNDSESDQESQEETVAKKKRHRRSSKISKQDQAEEKKKQAMKKHPLVVRLSIKHKDGTALCLTFAYMLQLKIITIKSTVNTSKPVTGVSAADVLSGFNILHELYPDDDGSDSPHPATNYILKTVGITDAFTKFIPELGRPYLWAQRMCGLSFASPRESGSSLNTLPVSPSTNLSRNSVENVLSSLQKRLKTRIGLMCELQDLESGKITPFEGPEKCPVRLSGSLTQWQTISWPEFSQSPATVNFVNSELVTEHDLLYRAIITRQSAKLVALVAIKSDYPKKGPLFALTLHWNGTHHARTDDDIRDIERCINTDWCNDDLPVKNCSLSAQLAKLLRCLDVLLEAMGSSEFPPDKIMFRPVRGRNRAKPYKFLKHGSGIFTQY